MGEAWRLLRSGHVPAARNMAIDEALMHSVAAGGRPAFRLYGWEPAAVSIGYFQNLEDEVDEVACRSLGIDVVRRLTGGRAVLHDVEVTYSLVIAEDHPLVPASITESYRVISEGLVAGLQRLGLDARLSVPARRREAQGTHYASPACFDAPSWYEVTVGGKKVIGSAQVRRGGVVLQHGSIPLELDVEKLFAVLRFPDAAAKERAKALFRERATGVRAALGRPVSFKDVSEAILAGLRSALGIEFVEGELTPEETALSEHLERTRYATDAWNRRQPVAPRGQRAT